MASEARHGLDGALRVSGVDFAGRSNERNDWHDARLLTRAVEAFRKHAHAAVDAIAQHMLEIEADKHPVVPALQQGDIIAQMPTHAPEHGEPFETIAGSMFDLVRTNAQQWQSGPSRGLTALTSQARSSATSPPMPRPSR